MATSSDLTKLMMICSANYKGWPEEGKEDATLALWQMMLDDIPTETLKKAIVIHLSRSKYPPTIHELREAADRLSSPQQMDAIEAWAQVTKAVRLYGYYRQQEALASMSDDVAGMVRSFGWQEICMNDNPDTLRAQFRMAWETQNKRKKEVSLFAPELVAMLEMPNLVKRLG